MKQINGSEVVEELVRQMIDQCPDRPLKTISKLQAKKNFNSDQNELTAHYIHHGTKG
jgi:hypothetical protein